MITISGSTVNETYPAVMRLISRFGVEESSRGGAVRVVPDTVAIETEHPIARVLFDPVRDANPFFHLCESVWMLAGNNDVAFPAEFVGRMREYSDDGETLHGAYGRRWRDWSGIGLDQLREVGAMLRDDPNTRRAVIGFWDPRLDLERAATEGSRDVPCNLTATFQAAPGWRDQWSTPRIDMTVLQRSGDAIWGVTGANAVHLSYLHEYVTRLAGGWQGRMRQVVVNLHAYTDVFDGLMARSPQLRDADAVIEDPYFSSAMRRRPTVRPLFDLQETRSLDLDRAFEADARAFCGEGRYERRPWLAWFTDVALPMRESWREYRRQRDSGAEPAVAAAAGLASLDTTSIDRQLDWYIAARNWFLRRMEGDRQA